jgi:predicted metal-dependent phosphoesterase TrpH
MSVAYFIVLDKDDVNFDPFVNGKAIAHAFDELESFCKLHQLKTIEDFHSQDLSEFMEELDEFEMPEQEEAWFTADEGIEWIVSLLAKLNSEKPAFASLAVYDDLNEYLAVFNNAKRAAAKWHLELDF